MTRAVTSLPFQMGNDYMVVIRDVPALVCNQCGESFAAINIVRQVEKIVKQAEMDGMILGFVKYKEAA